MSRSGKIGKGCSVKSAEAFIYVNGQTEKLKLPCTIAEFLKKAGWKPTQVVVERNGEVVSRSQVADIQLEDGDKLEVIVPVAGG